MVRSAKGEAHFVETGVAGGAHTPRDRIEATVPTVIGGVAKEDTRDRAWRKFVASCGCHVGKAKASEDTQ